MLAPTERPVLSAASRGPDLLNRPGVAYMRWNLESGSIIDVSPSVESILGYAPDEFVRGSDLAARITHPVFAREFPAMVAQWSLEKPEHVRFEGQFLARDGREVWLSISGVLEFSKSGDLTGMVAIAQDVTGLALARRAAEEARTLYGELFRSAPVPLVLYDAETLAIEDANAFACALYGIARDAFCASHFDERSSASELPRALERLRGGGKENPLHVVPRMEHVKGDGSPIAVQLITIAVNAGARPLRLAVVRELTTSDSAEAMLQVVRGALDSVPVPVAILDADSNIVFANPAIAALTGRIPAELSTAPFPPLLAARWDSVWASGVGMALRGGSWFGKVEFKGSHRRAAVALQPLLSSGPTVTHVVAVFDRPRPQAR